MKALPLLIFAISAIVGLILGITLFFQLGGGRIVPGVCIEGYEVGGCPAGALQSGLSEFLREQPLPELRLLYPGGEGSLRPQEVGAQLDIEGMVAEALSIGRRGSLGDRIRQILSALSGRVQIRKVITVDEDKLNLFLARLAERIDEPVVEAKWVPAGQAIVSRRGRRLNRARAKEVILAAWRQGEKSVVLPVEILEPETTSSDVQKWRFDHSLSRFTTYFDSEDEARTDNIILASAVLNGVVVKPGEVFSFNETIGPRTTERGYKEATEIVNHALVAGVGGGICQVSSTLYNAALLAGMEILERRNHSRPLGYVPVGRDATVYFDSIDLRFRNPKSFPVVILAQVERNSLVVSFWGQEEPREEISIALEDLEKIPEEVKVTKDPTLPPGEEIVVEEGGPGYRVKVYRVYGDSRRELISTDYYPPRARQIRVSEHDEVPPEEW